MNTVQSRSWRTSSEDRQCFTIPMSGEGSPKLQAAEEVRKRRWEVAVVRMIIDMNVWITKELRWECCQREMRQSKCEVLLSLNLFYAAKCLVLGSDEKIARGLGGWYSANIELQGRMQPYRMNFELKKQRVGGAIRGCKWHWVWFF